MLRFLSVPRLMGVGGVSNTLFGDMGQNKVNQYFPGTYSLEDRLGAVDSISSSWL
jgi:hypothetical protein